MTQDDLQREKSEYHLLPDAIKAIYTYEQWLWLPNAQKMNLETQESMVTEYQID